MIIKNLLLIFALSFVVQGQLISSGPILRTVDQSSLGVDVTLSGNGSPLSVTCAALVAVPSSLTTTSITGATLKTTTTCKRNSACSISISGLTGGTTYRVYCAVDTTISSALSVATKEKFLTTTLGVVTSNSVAVSVTLQGTGSVELRCIALASASCNTTPDLNLFQSNAAVVISNRGSATAVVVTGLSSGTSHNVWCAAGGNLSNNIGSITTLDKVASGPSNPVATSNSIQVQAVLSGSSGTGTITCGAFSDTTFIPTTSSDFSKGVSSSVTCTRGTVCDVRISSLIGGTTYRIFCGAGGAVEGSWFQLSTLDNFRSGPVRISQTQNSAVVNVSLDGSGIAAVNCVGLPPSSPAPGVISSSTSPQIGGSLCPRGSQCQITVGALTAGTTYSIWCGSGTVVSSSSASITTDEQIISGPVSPVIGPNSITVVVRLAGNTGSALVTCAAYTDLTFTPSIASHVTSANIKGSTTCTRGVDSNVTISGLVGGTGYRVFCISGPFVYGGWIRFSTASQISAGPESVSSTATSLTVRVTLAGTNQANVLCAAVTAGSASPSDFSSAWYTGTSVCTGSVPCAIQIANLASGTPYDVYCTVGSVRSSTKASISTGEGFLAAPSTPSFNGNVLSTGITFLGTSGSVSAVCGAFANCDFAPQSAGEISIARKLVSVTCTRGQSCNIQIPGLSGGFSYRVFCASSAALSTGSSFSPFLEQFTVAPTFISATPSSITAGVTLSGANSATVTCAALTSSITPALSDIQSSPLKTTTTVTRGVSSPVTIGLLTAGTSYRIWCSASDAISQVLVAQTLDQIISGPTSPVSTQNQITVTITLSGTTGTTSATCAALDSALTEVDASLVINAQRKTSATCTRGSPCTISVGALTGGTLYRVFCALPNQVYTTRNYAEIRTLEQFNSISVLTRDQNSVTISVNAAGNGDATYQCVVFTRTLTSPPTSSDLLTTNGFGTALCTRGSPCSVTINQLIGGTSYESWCIIGATISPTKVNFQTLDQFLSGPSIPSSSVSGTTVSFTTSVVIAGNSGSATVTCAAYTTSQDRTSAEISQAQLKGSSSCTRGQRSSIVISGVPNTGSYTLFCAVDRFVTPGVTVTTPETFLSQPSSPVVTEKDISVTLTVSGSGVSQVTCAVLGTTVTPTDPGQIISSPIVGVQSCVRGSPCKVTISGCTAGTGYNVWCTVGAVLSGKLSVQTLDSFSSSTLTITSVLTDRITVTTRLEGSVGTTTVTCTALLYPDVPRNASSVLTDSKRASSVCTRGVPCSVTVGNLVGGSLYRVACVVGAFLSDYVEVTTLDRFTGPPVLSVSFSNQVVVSVTLSGLGSADVICGAFRLKFSATPTRGQVLNTTLIGQSTCTRGTSCTVTVGVLTGGTIYDIWCAAGITSVTPSALTVQTIDDFLGLPSSPSVTSTLVSTTVIVAGDSGTANVACAAYSDSTVPQWSTIRSAQYQGQVNCNRGQICTVSIANLPAGLTFTFYCSVGRSVTSGMTINSPEQFGANLAQSSIGQNSVTVNALVRGSGISSVTCAALSSTATTPTADIISSSALKVTGKCVRGSSCLLTIDSLAGGTAYGVWCIVGTATSSRLGIQTLDQFVGDIDVVQVTTSQAFVNFTLSGQSGSTTVVCAAFDSTVEFPEDGPNSTVVNSSPRKATVGANRGKIPTRAQITGLTGGSTYQFYCAVGTSVEGPDIDTTLDVFTSKPNRVSIFTTTVEVSISTSGSGPTTVFCAALPNNVVAPITVAPIQGSQLSGSTNCPRGGLCVVLIDELTPGTEYDVYCSVGSVSVSSKLDITTVDQFLIRPTPPVIASNNMYTNCTVSGSTGAAVVTCALFDLAKAPANPTLTDINNEPKRKAQSCNRGQLCTIAVPGAVVANEYISYCALGDFIVQLQTISLEGFLASPVRLSVSSNQIDIQVRTNGASVSRVRCAAVSPLVPTLTTSAAVLSFSTFGESNCLRNTSCIVSIQNLIGGTTYDIYCTVGAIVSGRLRIATTEQFLNQPSSPIITRDSLTTTLTLAGANQVGVTCAAYNDSFVPQVPSHIISGWRRGWTTCNRSVPCSVSVRGLTGGVLYSLYCTVGDIISNLVQGETLDVVQSISTGDSHMQWAEVKLALTGIGSTNVTCVAVDSSVKITSTTDLSPIPTRTQVVVPRGTSTTVRISSLVSSTRYNIVCVLPASWSPVVGVTTKSLVEVTRLYEILHLGSSPNDALAYVAEGYGIEKRKVAEGDIGPNNTVWTVLKSSTGTYGSVYAGVEKWYAINLDVTRGFQLPIYIEHKDDVTFWLDNALLISLPGAKKDTFVANIKPGKHQILIRHVQRTAGGYIRVSLLGSQQSSVFDDAEVYYAGTSDDLSPNDRDGTIKGGVSTVTEGRLNLLRFDGYGYVEVKNSSSIKYQESTISAWFRSAKGDVSERVIWSVSGPSRSAVDLLGSFKPDKAGVQYGFDYLVSGGKSPNDGNWHHLVWVQSTSSQVKQRLYYDGVLVQQSSQPAIPEGILRLGFVPASKDITLYPYPGDLGEFGVWKRALSQDEVTVLYVLGFNPHGAQSDLTPTSRRTCGCSGDVHCTDFLGRKWDYQGLGDHLFAELDGFRAETKLYPCGFWGLKGATCFHDISVTSPLGSKVDIGLDYDYPIIGCSVNFTSSIGNIGDLVVRTLGPRAWTITAGRMQIRVSKADKYLGIYPTINPINDDDDFNGFCGGLNANTPFTWQDPSVNVTKTEYFNRASSWLIGKASKICSTLANPTPEVNNTDPVLPLDNVPPKQKEDAENCCRRMVGPGGCQMDAETLRGCVLDHLAMVQDNKVNCLGMSDIVFHNCVERPGNSENEITYVNQGCFKDNSKDRDLPLSLGKATWTPARALVQCQQRGFIFASIQNAIGTQTSEAFCGNSFGKWGVSTECVVVTGSNNTVGGPTSNSVYSKPGEEVPVCKATVIEDLKRLKKWCFGLKIDSQANTWGKCKAACCNDPQCTTWQFDSRGQCWRGVSSDCVVNSMGNSSIAGERLRQPGVREKATCGCWGDIHCTDFLQRKWDYMGLGDHLMVAVDGYRLDTKLYQCRSSATCFSEATIVSPKGRTFSISIKSLFPVIDCSQNVTTNATTAGELTITRINANTWSISAGRLTVQITKTSSYLGIYASVWSVMDSSDRILGFCLGEYKSAQFSWTAPIEKYNKTEWHKRALSWKISPTQSSICSTRVEVQSNTTVVVNNGTTFENNGTTPWAQKCCASLLIAPAGCEIDRSVYDACIMDHIVMSDDTNRCFDMGKTAQYHCVEVPPTDNPDKPAKVCETTVVVENLKTSGKVCFGLNDYPIAKTKYDCKAQCCVSESCTQWQFDDKGTCWVGTGGSCTTNTGVIIQDGEIILKPGQCNGGCATPPVCYSGPGKCEDNKCTYTQLPDKTECWNGGSCLSGSCVNASRWRKDGKCWAVGYPNLLDDGVIPAECNPSSNAPCCLSDGTCGACAGNATSYPPSCPVAVISNLVETKQQCYGASVNPSAKDPQGCKTRCCGDNSCTVWFLDAQKNCWTGSNVVCEVQDGGNVIAGEVLDRNGTNCEVSEWGSWSTCSSPCNGTQSRSRSVVTQPTGNGALCPRLQEQRDCSTEVCGCLCEVEFLVDATCTIRSSDFQNAKTLLDTLVRSANPAVGITFYHQSPVIVSPISQNKADVSNALRLNDKCQSESCCKSNLNLGIAESQGKLEARSNDKCKTLVVITESKATLHQPSIDAAKLATQSNPSWSVVAIGLGPNVDKDELNAIASHPANVLLLNTWDELSKVTGLIHSCPSRGCQLGEWSSWSSCSATCGSGTTTRTRTVTKLGDSLTMCPSSIESRVCNLDECVPPPTECAFSEWSTWSECSKSCGGTQKRTRNLVIQPKDKLCETTSQERICSKPDCDCLCEIEFVIDGGCSIKGSDFESVKSFVSQVSSTYVPAVGAISYNKEASVISSITSDDLALGWALGNSSKCTSGSECCQSLPYLALNTAEQEIISRSNTKCKTLVFVSSGKATGDDGFSKSNEAAKRIAKNHPDWSIVSVGLGDSSDSQLVKAIANLDSNVYNLANVEDLSVLSPLAHTCPAQSCNIGSWSSWSTCSVSCGGGVKTRTRQVTKLVDGAGCPSTVETQECNTEICNIDCVLSEWGQWTTCSQNCGGTQSRSRTIQTPSNGNGKPCEALQQTRFCSTKDCTCLNELEFLIDGSCSIVNSDFEKVLNFVSGFSESVLPGLGAVGYHRDTYAISEITSDLASFASSVKKATKCSQGTCCQTRTYLGLDLVESKLSARPEGNGKTIVVLTDGKTTGNGGPEATINSAKRIISSHPNWAVVAVGVGKDVNLDEIKSIASSPSNVYLLNSFDDLVSLSKLAHTCPGSNCQVSEWSTWSACSASCGGGSKTRTRTVKSLTTDTSLCPSSVETQSCNTDECVLPCDSDVVLAIDASCSINSGEWQTIQWWVNKISATVKGDLSSVIYDKNVKVIKGKFETIQGLTNHVKCYPKEGQIVVPKPQTDKCLPEPLNSCCGTSAHTALESAASILSASTKTSKTLVWISDGSSSYPDLTARAANLIKTQNPGWNIRAINIGDGSRYELETLVDATFITEATGNPSVSVLNLSPVCKPITGPKGCDEAATACECLGLQSQGCGWSSDKGVCELGGVTDCFECSSTGCSCGAVQTPCACASFANAGCGWDRGVCRTGGKPVSCLECPSQNGCNACDCDVVVVLNNGCSLSSKWNDISSTVGSVINSANGKVGLVTYDSETVSATTLGSKQTAKAALVPNTKCNYVTGPSVTHLALAKGAELLKTSTSACQTLILVSDGKSNLPSKTALTSSAIKRQNPKWNIWSVNAGELVDSKGFSSLVRSSKHIATLGASDVVYKCGLETDNECAAATPCDCLKLKSKGCGWSHTGVCKKGSVTECFECSNDGCSCGNEQNSIDCATQSGCKWDKFIGVCRIG